MKIQTDSGSKIFDTDPALPRYYRSLSFSFEAPYLPTEFIQILSAIPVFVVTKVEYSLDKGIWKIEAEAFEKRKKIIPLDM